jgi:hypothetical protein
MTDKYILDGKKAVPAEFMAWARWYETAGDTRVVAKTTVGESRVSTVFLGIDHNWGDGPPLLFETMVFEGPLDGEQERYSTWEEAEAGHAAMCQRVTEQRTTPQ